MSCEHGNHPNACDDCDAMEAAYKRGQRNPVEAATMINHEREPHCIGCYVINWNNGEPTATCNECGHKVELLNALASRRELGGVEL